MYLDDASLLCSIEPPNDVNSFCCQEDSGILFIAGKSYSSFISLFTPSISLFFSPISYFLIGEQPKIHTYYLPFLGSAPEWCCFLDNVTLELEKTKEKPVYQVSIHFYQFVITI